MNYPLKAAASMKKFVMGRLHLLSRRAGTLINHPERILLIFSLAPLIMLIAYVSSRAQIVPWLDEWSSSYPIVRKSIEGGLSITDLASFNVDHRIFIPNILTVLFAKISHWNPWLEVIFNIIIMVIGLLLIYDAYGREHKREHALYMLIPFSFLLLSIGQRENWIWGFSKQVFIVPFSAIVISWCITRWPKTRVAFFISFICTWIAAWSFASGNLLWVIVPVAFWLNGYRSYKIYGIWGISAILSLSLYLQDFPTQRITDFRQLLSKFQFLRYELVFLGGPFNNGAIHLGSWSGLPELSTRNASLFGFFGIILLVFNLLYFLHIQKKTIAQFSPWFVLISYSLASGFLLSVSRSEDLTHALIARYTTHAIPFWVSLVAIMISNMAHGFSVLAKSKSVISMLMIVNITFMGLLSIGYISNINEAYNAETFRDEIANCMISRLTSSERCEVNGFFIWGNNREFALDGIKFLAENNLSIFGMENYDTTYSLEQIPFAELSIQTATHYRTYSIGDEPKFVLFQHAPALIEYTLQVPNVHQNVRLLTESYLDPSNARSNAQVRQDGVAFQIRIQNEDGVEQIIYRNIFDPHVDTNPKPISIVLNLFKGTTIKLIFETDELENPNYDWSMWVDPRIEISDN